MGNQLRRQDAASSRKNQQQQQSTPVVQPQRQNRERTFLMLKPDAVQRGLIHKLVLRMQARGFKLVAMKMCQPGKALFEQHYEEHRDKPFFEGLVGRSTAGPVVAMVWEGDDVIKTGRKIIGATSPVDADLGTLRGDYGLSKQKNGFHGSDSLEAAKREIALWFKPEELMSFDDVSSPWLYEKEAPMTTNQTTQSQSTKLPKTSSPSDGSNSARTAAVLVGAAAVSTAVAYMAYKKKQSSQQN